MKPKHTQLTAGLSILALLFSFSAWPAASSAQNGHNYFWQPDFQHPVSHQRVCNRDNNNPNAAACDAHVVVDQNGKPRTLTSPAGYGPSQFQAAYNHNGVTGSPSQIIAVVDAYDNPKVYSDLSVYDNQFGLADLSLCTAGSSATVPCFQKIYQTGSAPAVNSGWALESSLDVQIAHAVCPQCSILLVEAKSSSYSDLMAAVDLAVHSGAYVVSNSYGSGEFSGETAYDSHFNHPGTAFTFSSGDSGYGVAYPAASPYVTAVGGTTLKMSSGAYNGETAWSEGGSGCSAYESKKPANQPNIGCNKRMVVDVSADADPNTGAAIYDSTPYSGQSGWFQVGGTSLASPIVAATYALAGDIPASVQANTIPYAQYIISKSYFHDVTFGSNGRCRSTPLFCSAAAGYDGPTGLGTPNGTGAF